jgi:hypothetical protein
MSLFNETLRANAPAMIEHAVEVLGRSKQRLNVFRAIYQGKKRVKTVNEICAGTGLSRIRVLQEARKLADNEIVRQIRAMGMTAYEKDNFYSSRKDRILRMVQNPVVVSQILSKKQEPLASTKTTIIKIHPQRINARYITIDEINSFSKVLRVKVIPEEYEEISERHFKKGISKILGENGKFVDWGGEQNDLYTDKITVLNRRIPVAFAFKGPGTRGILTPRKMGKNADQIQRLFRSAAIAFIIQYWGQIDQSVIEQMAEFAKAKSATEGTVIYYGVIDGDDSNRIIKAYPRAFNISK